MLTGEFPIANLSTWGRVVGAVIAVVAVALFAIPTGILGSGFVRALEKSTNDEGKDCTCPKCGHEFKFREELEIDG